MWPVLVCAMAGGLCDDFIWRKTGFVGAATTTLALFAYRLKSVLLLTHRLAQSLRFATQTWLKARSKTLVFAVFWTSKGEVRSYR